MLCLCCIFFSLDSKHYSPELVIEDADEPEEAGSFSPQLLQGDEDDEAIDPEEDWAELVMCRSFVLSGNFYCTCYVTRLEFTLTFCFYS